MKTHECYDVFIMKPLQVYLDDHEARRLETFARKHGWTKSKTVRVAIAALTRTPSDDPLLELSGMVRGLPEDLSTHLDHYLAETFDAATPGTETHTRRRARARRR
jgi:hypothetical protein